MSRNRNIFILIGSLAVVAVLSLSFFNANVGTKSPDRADVRPVETVGVVEKSNRPVEKTPIVETIDTMEVSFSVATSSLSEKVREGSTAYDLMDKLRSEGKMSFTADYYEGLGYFITSIGGIKNDGQHGTYWTYYVNGKEATVGASGHVLKSGDVVFWRYGEELKGGL